MISVDGTVGICIDIDSKITGNLCRNIISLRLVDDRFLSTCCDLEVEYIISQSIVCIGVQSEDLRRVLEFMYTGRVVSGSDSLLASADALGWF